jgi:hypothetical protein
MSKRLLAVFIVLMFAVFLVACKPAVPTEETPLTSITFSGVDDLTIDYDAQFNVLTGVTAVGNNGVDYTSLITYQTTGPVNAQHVLDTTQTGTFGIRYQVSTQGITQQRWRYITVNQPDRPDGLVVNGDFALGTVFWDDAANGFFVNDGASLTLSIDEGALKAEVVAGSNLWTPRFGQMNIPFEQGKSYEVSFKAKSSVPKTINLQVGELIDMAPWFVDFKPMQTERRLITTEWTTYSYVFTMNLDNPRGGILFEMGNVGGTEGRVDATLWFDDIDIVETVLGDDVVAPVFTGVREAVTVAVDGTFNPLQGITAYDFVDGDVTADITYLVYLVDGETETLVPNIDLTAEGVYKIVYSVSDEAGNTATAETILTVVLIVVEPVKQYPGWRAFTNFWESTTAADLQTVDGQLILSLSTIQAWENWHIQIIQDAYALGIGEENVGHMNLEAGKTYRVTFDAKASVAGNITLAIGHAGGGWTPYFVSDPLAVTTDMATFTIIFTLDSEGDFTTPAQFKLEMGMLFAGLETPQTFTLDNVKIDVEVDSAFVPTDLIFNGTMDEEPIDVYVLPEWRSFTNWWDGTTAELKGVNGQLVLTLLNINVWENWQIQIIQDAFALGTGADNVGHMQLVAGKTYKVTFDAKASVLGEITLAIGHAGGGWTPYFVQSGIAVTTAMQTFTYTFTLDAEGDFSVPAQFKLEMGMLFAGLDSPQTFILDNVKIEVQEGENFVDAKLIENGNMDAPVPYVIEQWRTFTNWWDGTTAEMIGLAGQLILIVTNINVWENWQIQIIQDAFALGTGADNVGHMQLVAGKTYKVTFDAMASVAGDITLAIGHAGGGWTPYFVKGDLEVTTEMQSFEVIFTLDAEGNYATLAQFKLEMGMLFAGLEAPQFFVLDNVKIEVLEGEAYVDADLIVNGTMEPPVPYEIEQWRAFTNWWDGTTAEMIGLAGELVLNITNVNVWENWQIQIIQDAFALGTGADNVGHMQLVAGKTYKVTFNARASVEGNFTLAIGHAGGGWTPYFVKGDLEVTTEMQSFEVIFTLDAEGNYTTLAQFKLEMGMLFAGLEAPQFFVLDNVLISVLEGEAYVNANLIVNGNMDLILGE